MCLPVPMNEHGELLYCGKATRYDRDLGPVGD
jgi:hypothetical protein